MPAHHHNSALRTLSQSYQPTHLLHLHLPGLTLYNTASAIQERIVQRHFAAKDQLRRTQDGSASASAHDSPAILPPPPLILTFSTPPTYTVGRRYLTTNPLPVSQIAFLQGLDASSSSSTEPLAAFHPSPRGGDLTYHGPGQLTAYAIIDLRTHNLTPRCYVRLLEQTVMRTCARLGVPNTTTTTDPGVWISEESPSSSSPSSSASSNPSHSSAPTPTDRKVCALGVQIRRGITAHGIGLNVHDHPAPLEYQSQSQSQYRQQQQQPATTALGHRSGSDPRLASALDPPGYLTWGFSRILACGLLGKTVTWLSREVAKPLFPNDDDRIVNTHPTNPQTHHDLDQNTTTTTTTTTTTNPRLHDLPSLTTSLTSANTQTAARLFAEEFADALALGLNTTNPSPRTRKPTPNSSPTPPVAALQMIDTKPNPVGTSDSQDETSTNPRNRVQSRSESKESGPVVRCITLHDIAAW